MSELIVDDTVPWLQIVLVAGQTNIDVPFSYLVDSGVTVWKNGVELTLTTDYAVNNAGTEGPYSLTLVSAAVGGEILTIKRATPNARLTDFKDSGDWTAANVNKELDRLTMVDQELSDKVSKAITAQDFDSTRSLVLPLLASCKGKALVFDKTSGDLAVSTMDFEDAAVYASSASNSAVAALASQTAAAASQSASHTSELNAAASAAAAALNVVSSAMGPVCSAATLSAGRSAMGVPATSDLTSLASKGAITSSGLTQATARLLGRTTAGTGAIEEISVGTGLNLTGGAITGGIAVVRTQRFTSSGTYTPDAHMVYCVIEIVGGGGGGGGVSTNVNSIGTGGGAGGYVRTIMTKAGVGASLSVTVGSGGTAGASGGGDGGNGGTTSIGSLTAGGGGGGTWNNTYVYTGGAGGTASGDLNCPGQPGGPGGYVGALSLSSSGQGGSSPFGGGGRAKAYNIQGYGYNGTGYGSGGGGAYGGGANHPGGAGAPGLVNITEYCTE